MSVLEAPLWTLSIKHGSQQLEVSIAALATVQELQEELQNLTGAFVRKQKLIFKGKVLPVGATLSSAGLSNGAKLMLLLSDGTAVATQGQQALQQQKKARQEEAAARVRELYAQAKGMGGAAASAVAAAAAAAAKGPAIDWQERKRSWEKTGIIALRDLGLTGPLPDDLFALTTTTTTTPAVAAAPTAAEASATAPRLADLSHNRLAALPPSLSLLTALHTLRLDRNQLCSSGTPWGAVGGLVGLTTLALDHNLLESIPEEALAGLRNLQVLTVSHNRLAALPDAVGQLTALQLVNANSNQLQALPDCLGCCASLEELAAEANQIQQLPGSLSRLQKLRTIRLDNNRISAVPGAILRDCASLSALSLQANPITADQLRSTPGFKDYDARRVARCNKQLDAGVLGQVGAGRAFTEGAEDRQWSRWAGAGGRPPGGGGGAGKG